MSSANPKNSQRYLELQPFMHYKLLLGITITIFVLFSCDSPDRISAASIPQRSSFVTTPQDDEARQIKPVNRVAWVDVMNPE